MKKILKRSLLMLLVLLLLAQIPFMYRRYQYSELSRKIENAAKVAIDTPVTPDPNFKEYKGIIHAHTNLGGHSTGSFEELIAAANANDLDFVLMTEHYSDTFDTAEKTLNGVYGKTLFVGGNEIDTSDGDRFLLIPGGGEAAKARMQGTTAFLEKAHAANQLALITYPERFKSWDSTFDGIEVMSLHTEAKAMNPLLAIGDLLWSYPSYPELVLAKGWRRPDANLAKFDEIASKRNIVLTAGTDAHSNIGFHLFGDDAGNKPLGIKLDPYATMFRMARLHVLLPANAELNRETLIAAIREGRFFVGFDALGDTSNFVFRAEHDPYPIVVGGEIPLMDPPNSHPVDMTVKLTAIAPVKARFVLFKNGEKLSEVSQTLSLEVPVTERGVYRVEVYRDELGPPFDRMPWIISNPIYVR